MEIVGKRIFVRRKHRSAVEERLQAAGVTYEIVGRGAAIEVRYQDTPYADHLLAPYLLPPER